MEKKNKPTGFERRSLPFEFRMDEADDKRIVRGHGAVYESTSTDLGGFVEIIHTGAFDDAIANSDIRALVNHDANLLLARMSAGNLKVETDSKGLAYEFQLGEQSYARDLAINLDAGNITQSSFAFTVQDDDWEETEDGKYIRHIYKVRELFDVSPVTYPAYEEADVRVAKRSLDQLKSGKEAELEKAKEQVEEKKKQLRVASEHRARHLQILELEAV